jgi:hypothetical protein
MLERKEKPQKMPNDKKKAQIEEKFEAGVGGMKIQLLEIYRIC